MTKRTVEVTITVDVEVDETKFDDTFMCEFRQQQYAFHSLDDHISHLAALEAQTLINRDFIEGYGPAKDMGIKAEVTGLYTEIVK